MARRGKPLDEDVTRPAKPVNLTSSKGAVRPMHWVCTHERHEEYGATKPDGQTVHIWRCLDCGAYALTPKE